MMFNQNTVNMRFWALTILLAWCISGVNPTQADEFGRFFTTSQQRSRLDELRKTEPAITVDIAEGELVVEENKNEEAAPVNVINVKGLVYRKDGKNTAWINESNSYEGDLASQYIQVKEENISKEKIAVQLPDNTTKVDLKVGNIFDPERKNILDLTNKKLRFPDKADN